MKIIVFLSALLLTKVTYGDSKIPGQLSFNIGSVSSSFSENPDKLKSTDGTSSTSTTAYSGTATTMPLDVSYEFFPNLKRSFFIRGAGPILASTPDRYFNANFGINFYFVQVGAQAKVTDYNFEMKIVPKLRYYAGPSIGVGYLVYSTKSATKNDMMLELGGQAGMIYTLNSKWGLKGELGASRAIGVLVSATIIKILIGTTYSIGL
jgi:hypothetical protein